MNGRTEVLKEFIRSVVRPALTAGSLGAAIGLVWLEKPVPDWLIGQVGSMIAWWFSDRSTSKPTTPSQ